MNINQKLEPMIAYAIVAPSGRIVMTFDDLEKAKQRDLSSLANRLIKVTTTYEKV